MNNQIVILLLGMLAAVMLMAGGALAQAREWMEREIARMEDDARHEKK
jgi:hypothetical protein